MLAASLMWCTGSTRQPQIRRRFYCMAGPRDVPAPSPGGKKILFDPWVTGNPTSPESAKKLGALDLMLITHGHSDHTGMRRDRAIERAQVIAPYEISVWLGGKGLQKVTGMNPGGTLKVLGLSITMVPAVHSSSVEEDGQIVYLGVATGYVITFEDGLTIYFRRRHVDLRRHAADRARCTSRQIAFLPIGDLYTMGPEQAAKASELLGVKQVVPMHYGTFPALTGTPAQAARAGRAARRRGAGAEAGRDGVIAVKHEVTEARNHETTDCR